MTSHHDVAVVVAELRIGFDVSPAIAERAAAILESQAKALSEHKVAYDGLMKAKETFRAEAHRNAARALAAEANLAEAMKVIERDMEALTEADTQIEYLHDKFKPTGSGANAIARIDIALTAARAFTNAAKEKTDAVG